jgi:hypothetical protein
MVEEQTKIKEQKYLNYLDYIGDDKNGDSIKTGKMSMQDRNIKGDS